MFDGSRSLSLTVMIRPISGSNFPKFSPMIPGGSGNDLISLFTLLLHVFC